MSSPEILNEVEINKSTFRSSLKGDSELPNSAENLRTLKSYQKRIYPKFYIGQKFKTWGMVLIWENDQTFNWFLYLKS